MRLRNDVSISENKTNAKVKKSLTDETLEKMINQVKTKRSAREPTKFLSFLLPIKNQSNISGKETHTRYQKDENGVQKSL